jgi:uncharacterized PurR-regulated membrane protein YhhQ (DUF165 family)
MKGIGMFGMDFGAAILIAIIFYLSPFIINIFLARSRGKSVILMFILTIIFSWIVTLILAFMPKAQKIESRSDHYPSRYS